MVLLARGGSHRTTTDAELIRWGADVARIEGRSGEDAIEVALVRPGSIAAAGGARKRIRVNGVARRAAALAERLRVVLFAPEDMLLVVGSPSLRRAVVDQLASSLVPAYAPGARDVRAGAPAAERAPARNSRRDGVPGGAAVLGPAVPRRWRRGRRGSRTSSSAGSAAPLAAAHAEIAPEEASAGALGLEYVTNAPAGPDETPREALARRLAETAEKELWNGTTLIGPHRDDVAFAMGGRDLSAFASRGQQRTAILAVKLAELDLVTAHDGRPPLLLLDDVFSELDPARRATWSAGSPTCPRPSSRRRRWRTSTPALRAIATPWEVRAGDGRAAQLRGAVARETRGRHGRPAPRRRRARCRGSAT